MEGEYDRMIQLKSDCSVTLSDGPPFDMAIKKDGVNDYIAAHIGGTAGGFIGEPFVQFTWKIGANYQQVIMDADDMLALAWWAVQHVKVGKNEIVGSK